MRRVCDDCRKKYQAEYSRVNRQKKLDTVKEWRKTRRWLDGADNRDDFGPELDGPIRFSINGELKLLNRR